jgi:NhaP-type Na+/H+ or K+/H+ antiporter
MTADLVYILAGTSLLMAVLLPILLERIAVSAPMVLLFVGALIGLLPQFSSMSFNPRDHSVFTEHLTEVTVIVALMGVGLALDRPLDLRKPRTWRGWGATWRLLGIAMPLCIASVALMGWGLGLAPAAAILLGAVLAPTDPVLASDVQVAGPTVREELDPDLEIDERDEVRFALTSEAGLNDGLAFPFVYFAIMVATMGPLGEWGLRWFAWELVGKIVVGVAIGAVVGWGLAKVAFRSSRPAFRLAETGEPLLALAAVLLSYGLAEVSGGYGFLSVFACAMALRSAERGHDYHAHMHGVVERLERLLTLAVLLLLGVAMTNGLLQPLTWQAAVLAVFLIFVFRPAAGWLSLRIRAPGPRPGSSALGPRERGATALLGVRGVGSLYYIAYATNQVDFGDSDLLWATVAFTVALSVLVHGVAAKPVMRRLDADRAV